ncbi:MAG: hypothetical protein JEZ08_04885 [Clostridiales bacterium]|nr:hypothetical protein [Clostridiales bacterium]
MTIISCIKQVYDLDIVLKDDWVVESDDVSINIDYANRIMNTFDETALELMLRLSDEHKVKTKVVTLGDQKSDTILRKSMAVGVDEAVRIDVLENLDFKPEQVAFQLKAYIQEENNKDIQIVMCGRQADNGNHGQTGQLLAEMLGWPCITMVTDIKKVKDEYKISRMVDSGIEHLYINTPVVVTVTQSDNKLLRMATLKAMLDAKKKPIEVYCSKEINETVSLTYKLEKLTINTPKKHCIFFEDKDGNSKTDQLIQLLKKQLGNEVY